jgi:hypothetical protein
MVVPDSVNNRDTSDVQVRKSPGLKWLGREGERETFEAAPWNIPGLTRAVSVLTWAGERFKRPINFSSKQKLF